MLPAGHDLQRFTGNNRAVRSPGRGTEPAVLRDDVAFCAMILKP